MKYNLHIITGIYGSGKTTYCQDKQTLQIDTITNYDTLTIDYIKLHDWLHQQPYSDMYLDNYLFDTDPNLTKLHNILDNKYDIHITLLYATNVSLYKDAFDKKWCNGPIFRELSHMSTDMLAKHVYQKTLTLLQHISNYNVNYLCRTVDNKIRVSSLDELLLHLG